MIKQSLELRVGQQLAMTPQLRQSIRLLQLSGLELQMEARQALESNLMLDAEDEEAEDGDGMESDREPVDIPRELPMDSTWEDIYGDGASGRTTAPSAEFDIEAQGSGPESLHDYLLRQMELCRFSDMDRLIAMAIIDAIDENGYLRIDGEDIVRVLSDAFGSASGGISHGEALSVLRRIQRFDPTGVGARDLRECLLLQLDALPGETPWRGRAMELAGSHLNLLGKRRHGDLMQILGLDEAALQQVIALIQSLDPRPGARIGATPTVYIIPDVFAEKTGGRWRVRLNPDTMPRLRINPHYAGLVRRANDSADNATLKTHLQEARWLLKGLRDRNSTLLKVATCIVERQRAFLDHGEEALEPMVTQDIADALGMHASTISRVTTRKYLHTPRGIVEFKHLFSSRLNTHAGGERSSAAVRALIKRLVAAEDARRPISDARLVERLAEQGIQVARRTVAKYRGALGILPSRERRRLS